MDNPGELPLDRFCHFIWWWLTHDAEDAAEVEKLRIKLWRPPKGVVPLTGPWSAAAETAAFQSIRSQLGLDTDPAATRAKPG